MRKRLRSDFAAVVLAAAMSCACGYGAQVDQQNWFTNQVATAFTAPQQEFTPASDTLDSVQLWIPSPQQLPISYQGGSCVVNIRDGVNGPILAASNPTYAPPGFSGTMGFGFVDPVHLTAGNQYVIEATQLGRPVGFFAATRQLYPGGDLWVETNPSGESFSLIFREGIGLGVVPEPGCTILLLLGLAAGCSCIRQNRRTVRPSS